MDKESIKQELILRVNALPEMKKKINKSDIQSFELTAQNLMATPVFAEKIMETLKQILKDKEIVFASEEERSELRQFLKPTNTELLRKYMTQ